MDASIRMLQAILIVIAWLVMLWFVNELFKLNWMV